MQIRTKTYSLKKSLYKKECLQNVFISQLWITLLISAGIGYGIYAKTKWIWITGIVLEILYILFWLLQITAVQYLPQNQILFSKAFYEFSNERILMFLDEKKCAQFSWKQIKKIKCKKDSLLMFLSKVQFIYVPYAAFKSQFEKSIFTSLLNRKYPKLKIKE